MFGKVFEVFAAIVTVALAFTIVSNKYTSDIINAFGKAFASGINVSTGGKGKY